MEANLHETPSTGHIEEAPSAAPEATPARIILGWVIDQVLRLVDHFYTLSVQRSQSEKGHYHRQEDSQIHGQQQPIHISPQLQHPKMWF